MFIRCAGSAEAARGGSDARYGTCGWKSCRFWFLAPPPPLRRAPRRTSRARAMVTVSKYGIARRAATASYGFVFYFWKTLLPTKLSPLYEIPVDFNPAHWIYFACALAVTALTLALIFLRKAWPAALAAWLAYFAMLLPVSGIAQSGPQLVAARYSYLPCLAFALLAGGAAAHLWR